MVRFTLLFRSRETDMRMELDGGEKVREVSDTAEDYFGGGFMLRNGYSLLGRDRIVGECIGDGDVVDVIPDPETLFSDCRIQQP